MGYMMEWIEQLFDEKPRDFDVLLDVIVQFSGEIEIRMGSGLWHETGIYTRRVWE